MSYVQVMKGESMSFVKVMKNMLRKLHAGSKAGYDFWLVATSNGNDLVIA